MPPVACKVINVQLGDPRYRAALADLRHPVLAHQMWTDAEHRYRRRRGKVWTVALVRDRGRWVPAAWAAAAVETDDGGRRVLVCSDNYERRGVGRDLGLYAVVHDYRHRTVIVPSGLPAVTYLFLQPIALHERYGWYLTGLAGTSTRNGIEPHDWAELRRDADPVRYPRLFPAPTRAPGHRERPSRLTLRQAA
ncbi:hypothetical protein [Polymorphospora sp. NPDC050346]|uniref:hypothetical protein n=1 Tax=Polymorphospora sp. NPDC050346 TaxID=3155780 RepID=UPI0033F1E601